MKKLGIIICNFICACISVYAQHDVRPYIDKGNSLYHQKEYRSAAVVYKHACILDSVSYDAWYNFGSALYKLEKYILASEAFEQSLLLATNNDLKFKSLHNLANAYVFQEEYAKAMNLYKQALLLNPQDNETRYNYAYVKKMIDQKQKEESYKNENDSKRESKQPQAFAMQIKKQADAYVAQYQFIEAYALLKDAEKKDSQIQEFYADYIKKIEEIVTIQNSKK